MLNMQREGTAVTVITRLFRISRTTFYRWRRRFQTEGPAGLTDRSSRPRHIRRRMDAEQVRILCHLRREKRWGPARLAPKMGVPVSTVYRGLRRAGLHRLPREPRPPVVRYEARAPGDLVHLDVLHLFALKGKKPVCQFTVVDDHTRMAYAWISPRRTTDVALEAVRQAQTAFGFPIRRVLTDNDTTFAWTLRPRWRGVPPGGVTRFTRTLHSWGIRHSVTRLGRPQTNGKVERFHRTIREELYRPHPLFITEEERCAALAHYLAYYNTQRTHTALGGVTPLHRRNQFFANGVSTTS